jgi:hypothetical protein
MAGVIHEREPPAAGEPEEAVAARAMALATPAPLSRLKPADALAIQRTAGNRALTTGLRLLQREPPPLSAHASAPNTAIHGQPFVRGSGDLSDIDPNDVNQGLLGDCNLLAPMAAVARANPEAIRRLISARPDGSYDVTLYYKDHFWSDLTAHTVNVTSQFYTDATGNPLYAHYGDTGELWVMLIEKAFARHMGSYGDAVGALWDREGLELLTGHGAHEDGVGSGSEDDVLAAISQKLSEGKAVTVNTSTSRWQRWTTSEAEQHEIDALHIVRDHAYSIEAVDTRAKTLNLRNPWGFNHLQNLPVAAFRRYFNTWSWVDVR